MRFVSVVARPVGATWGQSPADPFAGFPPPEPDDEEAEDDGRFGPLIAAFGAMSPAGPGVALAVEVEAGRDHTLELRLRHEGRYVRAGPRRWADRHGDLTVTAALRGGWERCRVHLPYVALPARAPRRVVVEGWLVEDGEPVAEALWPLTLPTAEARLLENALAAVAFAAVSAPLLGLPRPEGVGLERSRVAPMHAAIAQRFGLDDDGGRWLRELLDRAEPADLDDVVLSLRRFVDPDAWASILLILRRLAAPSDQGGAAEHRWLDRLEARLGASAPAVMSDALGAHYRTLGLDPGVSWTRVREAYRRLAQTHHPDRGGERPEVMAAINAAYAALRAALG